MFKVNNRNNRKYSKLTVETPMALVIDAILVILLLTLNIFQFFLEFLFVDFEHISQIFSRISFVDFEQVNACWISLAIYSKVSLLILLPVSVI